MALEDLGGTFGPAVDVTMRGASAEELMGMVTWQVVAPAFGGRLMLKRGWRRRRLDRGLGPRSLSRLPSTNTKASCPGVASRRGLGEGATCKRPVAKRLLDLEARVRDVVEARPPFLCRQRRSRGARAVASSRAADSGRVLREHEARASVVDGPLKGGVPSASRRADAEGPDVGALSTTGRAPARGSCTGGAEDHRRLSMLASWAASPRAGARLLVAQALARPKSSTSPAFGRRTDVGRLEVAVDDALRVGLLERLGDLAGDLQGLCVISAVRWPSAPRSDPGPARGRGSDRRPPPRSRGRTRCGGGSAGQGLAPRARSAPPGRHRGPPPRAGS